MIDLFAEEYLDAAMEEVDQEGGHQALLSALPNVAEAQGMTVVAERAGIPSESLYRALSAKGNPTIKTILAVVGAAGLKLGVYNPKFLRWTGSSYPASRRFRGLLRSLPNQSLPLKSIKY